MIDVEKRLTVTDAMKHPWFATIDWQQLYSRRVAAPFVPKLTSAHDHSRFNKYTELLDADVESVDVEFEEF